jgi:hypothetical protein
MVMTWRRGRKRPRSRNYCTVAKAMPALARRPVEFPVRLLQLQAVPFSRSHGELLYRALTPLVSELRFTRLFPSDRVGCVQGTR